MQARRLPESILPMMDVLEQHRGYGVFEPHAIVAADKARVEEVDLRRLQDRSPDVAVPGMHREHDVERLEDVEVAGWRHRRDGQVAGDRGQGEWRPDAVPEHLREEPHRVDLVDTGELHDIFADEVHEILPAPPVRLDRIVGKTRLGESPAFHQALQRVARRASHLFAPFADRDRMQTERDVPSRERFPSLPERFHAGASGDQDGLPGRPAVDHPFEPRLPVRHLVDLVQHEKRSAGIPALPRQDRSDGPARKLKGIRIDAGFPFSY